MKMLSMIASSRGGRGRFARQNCARVFQIGGAPRCVVPQNRFKRGCLTRNNLEAQAESVAKAGKFSRPDVNGGAGFYLRYGGSAQTQAIRKLLL